jgi:uncharacterized protein (TIGR03067 family)
MRSLGCLPLFVLCLVLPSATGDEMKSDVSAFQGEWRLTTLESDGKQNDVPDGDGAKVVFKGDRLLLGGEEKFVVKLDPSCDPKIIDLIPLEEENKDEVLEGIYRFSGSKLILCVRGPSRIRMRPVKFGEEESMVVTLEKVRAE